MTKKHQFVHHNGEPKPLNHDDILQIYPNKEITGNAIPCYIIKNWKNEFKTQKICKLCHIIPNVGEVIKNNDSFGMPFIVSIPNKITNKELYEIVYQRLFMWFGDNVLKKPPNLQDIKTTKIDKIIWSQLLKNTECDDEIKTCGNKWYHSLLN